MNSLSPFFFRYRTRVSNTPAAPHNPEAAERRQFLFEQLFAVQIGVIPAQRQQLVGIPADNIGDGPHFIFGRRLELVALDFRQVGRAHPDHLGHLAQANFLRLSFPTHKGAPKLSFLTSIPLLLLPLSVNLTLRKVNVNSLCEDKAYVLEHAR